VADPIDNGDTPGNVLAARQVNVRFEGLLALDQVSLTLQPTQILGLIGPNGAGKTTLVNVMTGFQAPNEGRVALNGQEINGWPAFRIGRHGLAPKRRTAILFDPAPPEDVNGWPIIIDADEQFYFKPDAGRLLGSPADETASPPCDAQPEEIDVALAVDRIEQAATFRVERLVRKWAGLRNFVADKSPVVGLDAELPGFFWLVGQGGYGIQTSPALGRVAAALIGGGEMPEDLQSLGVRADNLSPARLH
jgi:glycine/D-amino acid oxidase-like deaminating enzyme